MNDRTLIREGLWHRWLTALMNGDLVKAGILYRWHQEYVDDLPL